MTLSNVDKARLLMRALRTERETCVKLNDNITACRIDQILEALADIPVVRKAAIYDIIRKD